MFFFWGLVAFFLMGMGSGFGYLSLEAEAKERPEPKSASVNAIELKKVNVEGIECIVANRPGGYPEVAIHCKWP